MTALSILLPITIIVSAVFQYQYPRTGRRAHHLALVIASCAVDFVLMLAFTSSGDYETWAWIAAGSTFIAAVAGNVILLVGSRHLSVRPGPYYVATTLAVATAVCCAAIDKSTELRTDADVLADYVPFAVGAVLLVVAAIAIILAARPGMRERMSGKFAYVGCAALAVASGFVVASLVGNFGDGVSGGLSLETPLNYYDQSLSPLVAVLAVLGITLVFHGRRRPGGAASLGMVILPALLVLLGLDAGVAMALLVGLLLVLDHGPRWAKAATPYLLVGLVAICAAIAVSPSASAATEYYWALLADAENGGNAYEAIMLLATAGPVIDLSGQGIDFSLGSEYGSLSLLAHFLGLPTFVALSFMCVASVLGCWAGRKRFGRSGHSPAFPVGATLVCIAYVAALTGLGIAPGYAPFPFVNMFSEYSTAGYMLAIAVVCLCECRLPIVVNASSEGEPQTAIVPAVDPGARSGWKPFTVALAVTVACCIGLYAGIGALKDVRDRGALVALALTYPDDTRSRFLDDNPLADRIEGEPIAITSTLIAPTRVDGEDGAMLRLVKRYKGGVNIEEDWRFIFPDSVVDIGRLWETPHHLAHADALPAVGYPITDLLDESYFEEAFQDALIGYRRNGDLRAMTDAAESERVEEALEAIDRPVELKGFEIQRFGPGLTDALGACTVNLGTSGVLKLKCRFSWNGDALAVGWLRADTVNAGKDE